MTPDQQMEALRAMAARAAPVWLKYGLTIAAATSIAACVIRRESVFLALGAIAAVVALSTRTSTPHIFNAARALTHPTSSVGTVLIEVTQWSDSPSFHATAFVTDAQRWKFEFIPLGWNPQAGIVNATLFYIAGVEWPVLVRTEHGILFPRGDPERIVV
jgi:hypothetical protein